MAGKEGAEGSSSSSSCPSLLALPLPTVKVGTGACGLRKGSCFWKGGGGGGMALRSRSALALWLLSGGSALVIMGSWISVFGIEGVFSGIDGSISSSLCSIEGFSGAVEREPPLCFFAPDSMEGRSHWKQAHDFGG